VALDGAVVPRVSWPGTSLHPDARIDVFTAVQGG
jgi:sulfur carrier protein